MKHITDAIVVLFQDSCFAAGYDSAFWHGEYFSEKAASGPQMKFGLQCNIYGPNANLSIMANDLSPLLDRLVVNDQTFLTIRPSVAIRNDCPYFEYTSGNAAPTLAWLVTADNQPLYIPVTRREYLIEARMELNNTKKGITAYMQQKMPVRSAAVQEADKKAAMDQLSAMYSGTELKVRMKMLLQNYKSDEEYLKENTDKETAQVDSTLHLMNALLEHMPATELNKPAIVSVQAADFRGFEDGYGDKMLIRMNEAYFKTAHTEETPLFFLVSVQHDQSVSPAGLDSQVMQKFDSQKLK